MGHLDTPRVRLAGGAIVALALTAAPGAAVAQDESPAASTAPASTAAAHPLHIHSGSCAQLGDVVFPFGFISQDLMVHGEPADGEELGAVTDQDVALNVTTVDATIADLTASDHAINIHESEEAMDVNIACADIGGTLIDDDTLVLRLEPTDESGYHGFVLLQEDDDQTTAYSMLMRLETDPVAADEPTAEEASAEPGMDAGAESEEPGMEASAAPSLEASAEPGAEASAEPGAEASAEPGAEASAEPGAEASAAPDDGEPSPDASPAG